MYNNSYLSKCDLINKFCVSNLEACPKINKIIIQFSLANLNKGSGNIVDSDIASQIKSVLLFYILNGFNPNISYNNQKIAYKTSKKEELSTHINKIILENTSDISNFVNFLFIENDYKNLSSFYNTKKSINNNLTTSVSFNIPMSIFKDLVEFSNFSIKDISLKDINIHVNFILKTESKLKENFVESVFPLWHLG